MELETLQKDIFSLATIDETDAPFVSYYLNLGAGESGYRKVLDERVRLLRASFTGRARQHLEEALHQIDAFLQIGTAGR